MNSFDTLQLSRAYHLAHASGHPWAVNFSRREILIMSDAQLSYFVPGEGLTAHKSYYSVQSTTRGSIYYQGPHLNWEVAPDASVQLWVYAKGVRVLYVTLATGGQLDIRVIQADTVELSHVRLLERTLREILFPEELDASLDTLRQQAFDNEKSALVRQISQLNAKAGELAGNDNNRLWPDMEAQTQNWLEGVKAI